MGKQSFPAHTLVQRSAFQHPGRGQSLIVQYPPYVLYRQALQRAHTLIPALPAGEKGGEVQRSAESPSSGGERRLMMADYAKFANSHPLSALIGPPVGVKRPPEDDLLPAQPKRQAALAESLPDPSTIPSRPSRDKARDASGLQVCCQTYSCQQRKMALAEELWKCIAPPACRTCQQRGPSTEPDLQATPSLIWHICHWISLLRNPVQLPGCPAVMPVDLGEPQCASGQLACQACYVAHATPMPVQTARICIPYSF